MGNRTLALCCGVLTVLTLAAADANAVAVYSYVGNNYTVIVDNTPPAGSTYSNTLNVTASFTVAAPFGPNMPLTDISGLVLSYSFSDGVHTHTELDSSIVGSFDVATGANGAPSDWDLTTADGPPLGPIGVPGSQREVILTSFTLDRGLLQECTGPGPGCGTIFSDVGQVGSDPGLWGVVPEPSTAALVTLGLLGLAARRQPSVG